MQIIFCLLIMTGKYVFLCLLLLVIPWCAWSAVDSVAVRPKSKMAFSGCSGGMMFHIGYAQSRRFSLHNATGSVSEWMQIKGAPYGIGGAMRAHFGKHLRVGSEGYVSHMNYGGNDSRYSVGWGGVLADSKWDIGRWTLFVGMVVGGGGVKNLTLLKDTPLDYELESEAASYRKYAFCAVDPFFGVEYAMTRKIHLVLKGDCLLNVSNPQLDYVLGPRFFVGIMFCH